MLVANVNRTALVQRTAVRVPSALTPLSVRIARPSKPSTIVRYKDETQRDIDATINRLDAKYNEAQYSDTDASEAVNDFLKQAQQNWDRVQDKPRLFLYAGASVLILLVSDSLLSAVDRIPLFPRLLQLIGLGYSSWFFYNFVLFKEGRQRLASDIEDIKKRISENTDDVERTGKKIADQAGEVGDAVSSDINRAARSLKRDVNREVDRL